LSNQVRSLVDLSDVAEQFNSLSTGVADFLEMLETAIREGGIGETAKRILQEVLERHREGD
jgi:hypothetical protein